MCSHGEPAALSRSPLQILPRLLLRSQSLAVCSACFMAGGWLGVLWAGWRTGVCVVLASISVDITRRCSVTMDDDDDVDDADDERRECPHSGVRAGTTLRPVPPPPPPPSVPYHHHHPPSAARAHSCCYTAIVCLSLCARRLHCRVLHVTTYVYAAVCMLLSLVVVVVVVIIVVVVKGRANCLPSGRAGGPPPVAVAGPGGPSPR